MNEIQDAFTAAVPAGGLAAIGAVVYRLFARTDDRREDLLDRYERRIAQLEAELAEERKG